MPRRACLVGLCLCAAASSADAGPSAAALEANIAEALLEDGECSEAECALNAVQLRGVAKDSHPTPGQMSAESNAISAKVREEGGAEAKSMQEAYKRLVEKKAWLPKEDNERPAENATSSPSKDIDALHKDVDVEPSAREGFKGLYTFGAPGTAKRPLRNQQSEDGIFPGVRAYTLRVQDVLGISEIRFHDPVAFFANVVNLRHPLMDTLVLHSGYSPKLHHASVGLTELPEQDLGFWVAGHEQDYYVRLMERSREPYNEIASDMAVLARAVYPNINEYPEDVAKDARSVGWNLVARSLSHPLREDRGDVSETIVEDYTYLFQEEKSLSCALVFVGTHDTSQWIANFNYEASDFCGLSDIHAGFRNQVRRATRSRGWSQSMQPALQSCKELYVAGHSLGAAEAELFTACMLSEPLREDEDGYEDYQAVKWSPAAEAAALPELS